jgi:uncharacterized membrane protein YidH (DUF202 family)
MCALKEESKPEPYDPRMYLAAERTFLAWIRTGLALMGLGFIAARFGLFLRVAFGTSLPERTGVSLPVGIALRSSGAGGWNRSCVPPIASELPTPEAPVC